MPKPGASTRKSNKPAPKRAPSAPARKKPHPEPTLNTSAPDGYWALSMRPLHVLLFLMPLVVLYEVGSAMYLTDISAGTRESIKAYRLFGDFFNIFGVAGFFVPGVALVTVLLVWHLISGDRWVVKWNCIAGMAAESVAWTLPLIVLSAASSRLAFNMPGSGGVTDGGGSLSALAQGAGNGSAAGAPILADLTWQAKLAVSIGAGLYEEMLFRLVGIALIHFVLKDLLDAREHAASAIAVVGSAIAFALYHDVAMVNGQWNWVVFSFFTLAGIYLGTVYVLRGFGIVVGTHALYDIVVLVLLAPGHSGA